MMYHIYFYDDNSKFTRFPTAPIPLEKLPDALETFLLWFPGVVLETVRIG